MIQPPNDPLVEQAKNWAREIEAASGGALSVVIYPGGELYGTRTQITALARGHVEAAFLYTDYWGQTIPELSILSRPFAFAGTQDMSSRKASRLAHYLTDAVERKGLKVLAWIPQARMMAITSQDGPLATPADFAGKKIRSVNRMLNAALGAAGAAPIPLPGGDVYMALQTGMVDGALSIPIAVYRRRYYEVNDHVTLSPLFVSYQAVAVNGDWWDALPTRLRAVLLAASERLEAGAAAFNADREAETPQLLREKGMQVHVLGDAEIAVLRALMEPAWNAAFLQQTGDRGPAMLQYLDDALREEKAAGVANKPDAG